jgi:hypothetical protein
VEYQATAATAAECWAGHSPEPEWESLGTLAAAEQAKDGQRVGVARALFQHVEEAGAGSPCSAGAAGAARASHSGRGGTGCVRRHEARGLLHLESSFG